MSLPAPVVVLPEIMGRALRDEYPGSPEIAPKDWYPPITRIERK